MTLYYVASDGSNTSPYDTWAKAATTFAAAVTAATGNGDIIYVDQGFTNTLSADTTYTFGNNVQVICSNDKVNAPPQTLGSMGESAFIGDSANGDWDITIRGGYRVYLYGLTFRCSGSATSSGRIFINQTDNGHFEIENCLLWNECTGEAPNFIVGANGESLSAYTKIKNCVFRTQDSSSRLYLSQFVEIEGGSWINDGTAPTVLLGNNSRSTNIIFSGVDLSALPALTSSQSSMPCRVVFENCKLYSGVTVLQTQTPTNKGSASVWLFNCASADQHYHLQHHDAFGSTIVDTGIYANDGASYDGTNRCSWKIVTTANCSYYTPYVSPWIDCYHSGTSAITPSIEIVRSGSATAYQDDEVWGEFSYQGTSGFPLATLVNDRKALLAAAADQTTGALGASDWTGENATSWFGKLNPTATITPAEIGHLRARVCVGEPGVTVYLDPTIRGRS